MKEYRWEVALLMIQMAVFYFFPLFADLGGELGLVLLIVLSTFTLSVVMGTVSAKGVKWVYPAVSAVLFVSSVFIYYNKSALVHSLWYLVVSMVGLTIGSAIGVIRRVDKR